MPTIKNLFDSRSLPGDQFCIPLRNTHQFLEKKRGEGRGVIKLAWTVAQLAAFVFLYPIFGCLALIGIGIKFLGISSLREHNRGQLDKIQLLPSLMQWERTVSNTSTPGSPGRQIVEEVVRVNRQNAEEQCQKMQAAVQRCSRELKKIYLQVHGNTLQGGPQEIVLTLLR